MIGQSAAGQGHEIFNLTEKELLYKQKIGMELLEVANIISPGISRRVSWLNSFICLYLCNSIIVYLDLTTKHFETVWVNKGYMNHFNIKIIILDWEELFSMNSRQLWHATPGENFQLEKYLRITWKMLWRYHLITNSEISYYYYYFIGGQKVFDWMHTDLQLWTCMPSRGTLSNNCPLGLAGAWNISGQSWLKVIMIEDEVGKCTIDRKVIGFLKFDWLIIELCQKIMLLSNKVRYWRWSIPDFWLVP